MALFWRLIKHEWFARGQHRHGGVSLKGAESVGSRRNRLIGLSLLIAAVVAITTPPLWTTHRPRFLPWMLESYINGVHNFDVPTPWIFSIFPWCGFAFVGLAFGLFLFSDFAQRKEVAALAIVGAIGALACALSLWWDYSSVRIYAVYDYWHSSPNFFLMRCGILLLLTFAIFVWCRWGWVTDGFSPCIQFGKTSLAGLLGAHRICVRQIVHLAKIAEHYSIGDGGHGGDFCGDAGALDMAHARQKARGS